METLSITSNQKSNTVALHLSTFSKWFFPFGNYIIPLILWYKNESPFVEHHGRQQLNFQISTFLYTVLIIAISIPFFIWQGISLSNQGLSHDLQLSTSEAPEFLSGIIITAIIVGVLLIALFIFELIVVLSAAVAASRGEDYKFPLTIPFIKPKTM